MQRHAHLLYQSTAVKTTPVTKGMSNTTLLSRRVFTSRFVTRSLPPTMTSNCHINEGKRPKTCLTNHKGSISHHIKPLVIYGLRGGDTHTHTRILHEQKQYQEARHAPSIKNISKILKLFVMYMLLSIIIA